MGLLDDVPEGSLVALDTAAWIYEVASAVEHRADLFLSNDADLRKVKEIRVLVLSDYVGSL